jgi:hypothetical protein
MAHIIVIRHAGEEVDFRHYALHLLAEIWREAGHRVTVVPGVDDLPDGDLAFLHVDLSVVPEAYVEAARRYPRVVNGRATDIRKRCVSSNLLTRDSDWPGPVMVKSDLNFGGVPEWRIAHPGEPSLDAPDDLLVYSMIRDLKTVPEEMWNDPRLIVERYLPEHDSQGFYVRTWMFLGDRGRCRRSRGTSPVVKSGTIVAGEPDEIPVPDFIRAERERLGFDYGKFDFAVHDGTPVLFDANKTFGVTPSPGNRLYHYLAQALGGFLR